MTARYFPVIIKVVLPALMGALGSVLLTVNPEYHNAFCGAV